MKKLLILALALLLCGCGAMPPATEPVPTEPPAPTLPPETEPTVPETLPLPGELTAEDGFYELYTNPNNGRTYCVHIPRLVLNGDWQLPLNEQIHSHHMRLLSTETYGEQIAVDSFWALGQTERYASIISTFCPQEYDHTFHSLFHLDKATGSEASDEEILAAFGYTRQDFRDEIYRTLAENFEKNNPWLSQQAYNDAMTLQLSDANLGICRPFIDPEGRLCATNFAYGYSSDGQWYNCLCLQTGEPAIFNTTGCDHCG